MGSLEFFPTTEESLKNALICFHPFEFLAMEFYNQHSIRMYDRRLFAVFRVKLLEILLKKRLSFGASVYPNIYSDMPQQCH
jgi:hypothetical protein